MADVDVDAIVEAAVSAADVEEPDLEPFRSNLELLVGASTRRPGSPPRPPPAPRAPLRNPCATDSR